MHHEHSDTLDDDEPVPQSAPKHPLVFGFLALWQSMS